MAKDRTIPISIVDEEHSGLRPPGDLGSPMAHLLAAGTHRVIDSGNGITRVVPVDSNAEIDEIVIVVRRASP